MNHHGKLPTLPVGSTQGNPGLVSTRGGTLDNHYALSTVAEAEDDDFGPESAETFEARIVAPIWSRPDFPWLALVQIVLGAALTIVFGLTTLAAAREQASAADILRSQPAWQNLAEGPSTRWAALRNLDAGGVVDRYVAAERRLDLARSETGFGLAVLVLGISLVVRRSARFGTPSRVARFDGSKPAVPLGPFRRALLAGWVQVEAVGFAAFRLIGVAFVFLLIGHIMSGAPPTWDVLQETLDRVIAMIDGLAQLAR